MSLMRWFSITLLSLLMIACGGGGSIEKDTSGGGGTNTDYELVLTTSSASGGSLSISNPITITAKLTNDGAPIANNLVNFTNDEFSDFASVSSQLTDSNGEAKVTIIANRAAGAGTISATADVGENTVTGSVPYAADGDGGIQIAMTITGSDGLAIDASNPIAGSEIATVTAILTDNGTPLSGQVLEFSREADSENLLVTNGNSNVQTDANGAARLLVQATDEIGAGYVQVTYNEDINARIGFESAGNPFYDKEIYDLSVQLVDANDQTSSDLSLATPLTAKIQLTLNEQPVANADILVEAEESARFAKPTESVRTDATGQAEIQLFATSTATVAQQLDAFTATYMLAGEEAARTVASYVGAGDGGIQLTVSVEDAQNEEINKENPLSLGKEGFLKVNLKKDGQPLVKQLVTVSELVLADITDNGTAETDSNGDAELTLSVNDSRGWEQFTVTYTETDTTNTIVSSGRYYSNGLAAGAGVQLTVTVLDLNGNAINEGNPLSATNPGQVVVTLREDDTPLSNELITVSGGLKAVTSPSDGVSNTNSSGEARVTLIPNQEEGWAEVTASFGDGGAAVTKTARYFSSGDPNFGASGYQLTLVGKNAQGDESNSLSAQMPLTIEARLTFNGNVQENQNIQLSVNEFGVLDPESGSVLTNNEGIATIQLLDNSISGAGRVSARYEANNGVIVTQNFNFNSAGDGGVNISIVSILDSDGDAISTQLSGGNKLAEDHNGIATVQLIENGLPLSGKLVTFTTDSVATMNPQSGRAVTDENGFASVELLATNTSGIGEVYAEYLTFSTPRVTFASDGAVIVDEGEYKMVVRLLINCQDDWDSNRDATGITDADLAKCDEVTNVPSTELAEVYVKLTPTANPDKGIENAIVSVQTNKGQILPSSGQVLTDLQGVGLLKLQPGDSGGAGTITASYLDESDTKNFSVGIQDLFLSLSSELDSGGNRDSLAAGDSFILTATIFTDEADPDNSIYGQPVDVEFTSTCADEGLATIDGQVRSKDGKASSTYRAQGCSGNDTIVVTVTSGGGVNDPESYVFTVDDAPVQAIQFIEASNAFIALPPGLGATPTTSTVKFKLLDTDDRPLKQKQIEFRLADLTGSADLTNYKGSTDSEGFAQTTVQSGVVPGAIVVEACYISDEVIASYATTNEYPTCWQSVIDQCATDNTHPRCPDVNDNLTLRLIPVADQVNAVSSGIVLSSGVPDQNSFDIAADNLVLNALNYVGVTTNISVYFGDQFNQLTGDNLVASVTAEAGVVGSIDGTGGSPSYQCAIVDGVCTVQWRKQGEFPYNDTDTWRNTIGDVCDTYGGQPVPCINGFPSVYRYTDADGNFLQDQDGNDMTEVVDGVTLPAELPVVRGGRITVLATAKGQESFIDKQSSADISRTNGIFDEGEFFSAFDLPEAFVDHNKNGTFDAIDCNDSAEAHKCTFRFSDGGHNETYLDGNNDLSYTSEDNKYNGLLCGEQALTGGHCTRDLVDVRRDLELIIAGDVPYARFVIASNLIGGAACTGTINGFSGLEQTEDEDYCDLNVVDLTIVESADVEIYYSDLFGNAFPTGTTVSITADNGEISISEVNTIVSATDIYGIKKAVVKVSRETAANSKTTGNLTITFTIPSPFEGQDPTIVSKSMQIIDAG
ncbi:hypothetical protein [Pseudoalteromonas sp. McH1-42]|uniref:hypothetical protein n=1 Tax=Pseudoalteromonas sp. McH1-42 TaxID=2917752 RepID=UPI001EF71B00|nr:hypothetical protein [Pseudoalteromonas sp. McH1-42]MCG7564142.1 hypothetical protein [Pseudoalteromonas sp. McH1-42]